MYHLSIWTTVSDLILSQAQPGLSRGRPCGVMVELPNRSKRVRTPVALLCSLPVIYPWERYEPPYPPCYGLNSTTTVTITRDWKRRQASANDLTHRKGAEDFGRFWKSHLVEMRPASREDGWFSLARGDLCGGCHMCCGGWWKSQNRKIVPLSPYVEEPLNSKVIKSFIPEQRSRQVFFVYRDSHLVCYICNERPMYISHIRLYGYGTIILIIIIIRRRMLVHIKDSIDVSIQRQHRKVRRQTDYSHQKQNWQHEDQQYRNNQKTTIVRKTSLWTF